MSSESKLLANLLLASADCQRIVALSDSGPVTVRDLRGRAMAWAAALDEVNCDRVLLFEEDSVRFAAALIGAWHAGKHVLLPGDALPATIADAATQDCIRIGQWPDALPEPQWQANADRVAALLVPDAVPITLFTSGSAGKPVAIVKSLRQLLAEIEALERCFGDRLGDSTVAGSVSHQHIYGLLFRVLWPIACGRPFHATQLRTPEQIAALAGEQSLVLVASPAHLKRLPESLDWQGFRNRLQAVFSSGGALPVEAGIAALRLWSRQPIEVFGSTETGGIAWRQGAGQAWSALPGVQWRIVEQQLLIRSPHLPNLEWLATSDRAEAVAVGFTLLGRADRIAKIEERRVSLCAIEEQLLSSGLLAEARVVVLAGSRTVVAAVAVANQQGMAQLLREGKRAFSLCLRAHLKDAVDPIAMPRRWRFVEAMPCNTQGKTTEAMLSTLFRPRWPPCQWLERDEVSATAKLQINPDLAVFDGHFPALAVLPGIAMVDWCMRLGREAFALPAQYARMEVLKFQLLVQPGITLHLQMHWNASAASLAFSYSSDAGIHASGRLIFAEATP